MRAAGRFFLISTFALLAPGAMAQAPEPVAISLTNYAFTPSNLDLKVGAPYRLHFTNTESKDHNFSAPQFFAAGQLAAEDQAKVKSGTVDVAAGQSVDIVVTPGRAGTYSFTCTHFMHSTMGMHGTITVQ